MPLKSQKKEKKSLEFVSRRPSSCLAAALPQEKPTTEVDTRKIKTTRKVKQLPLEESKMADHRLKERAAADPKLPVATSSKKTLEFVQTDQKRRSRDVSREREKANTTISIEAPLVATPKAPKRSATPVPESFFETGKKKMKMSSSGQLFNNPEPNPNPKVNPIKESAKIGQGPAPKPSSSVADIEIASCEPMEIAVKGLLGPIGYDGYYLEQFYKFYEDYRACTVRISKRLMKLEDSNTQKHYENVSLQSRLRVMLDKKNSLEDKLSLQHQLNAELHGKYLDALEARTIVEKERQVIKSVIDQQKAELEGNQSEINNLRAELNNLEVKLKHTEETVANLLNENNKQEAELKEQKLKIQETVAEREVLERRNSELESELKKLTLEVNELNQRQVELEGFQQRNEEITNQLEVCRNEREILQISLNERTQELEASQLSLVQINEEHSNELMKLMAEKEGYEETISSLESILSQKSKDLEQLAESHKKLEVTNIKQFSQHSKELQNYEAQNIKLQETVKSFENELQVQAQSLKAEQENRIRETQKGQVLKSELEGERKRHEAELDALKTALEHRDRASSAEQAKMQSLEAELDELKKINSSLKAEKKQMDTELSEAKKTFDEELKHLSNNLKNKIFALQEDIKQKDIKHIGLEHEKNDIIKQLKNKIKTICNTIEKPIIASTMMSKSPDPKKTSLRRPRNSQKDVEPSVDAAAGSPSTPFKRRKAHRLEHIRNDSDFESEEDVLPIKMLLTKRENLAVVRPQEDVFDALKNGTI